jgi:hypothetical protein
LQFSPESSEGACNCGCHQVRGARNSELQQVKLLANVDTMKRGNTMRKIMYPK